MKRRPAKVTVMRRKAELRAKNVMYLKSVREAKDRASLKVEQDRLHSLVYEQISPGLRERIQARRQTISQLLTPG